MCHWKLAEHLGLPVVPLSNYTEIHPEEIGYLSSLAGQAEFSAITLCDGPRRLIIYNDAHSKKRQAADVTHELSHCILLHPAKPTFDAKGSRHYDETLEEEANWLGPALLISEQAALRIVAEKISVPQASDLYGVSEDIVRMRLNVTAAYKRVSLKRNAA